MDEPIVFLNDKFVPASEASINVYDLGVVMGVTMTEFTRTFNHAPYRLEDHVARLYRSCKYSGLNVSLSPEALIDKTRQLIETNCQHLGPNEDLGIVHFITAGENRVYAGNAAGSVRLEPTVCVHSFRLPFEFWRHLFTDGAHLVTPSIRHIPPQCVDPKTKNRSRMHWWLADQQSHAVDPKAISLLLDVDGNLTECSGANFVMLAGDTLYSPTSRNILVGISLLTVRDIAGELGLKWVEKDLQSYDVINADEVWLTTTPYCMAPCTKINAMPIGDGKPGPIFTKVINAWSECVGMDILRQIVPQD